MPSHEWGDDWFEEHGGELIDAIDFISNYVNENSYYYLSMKEKYGTIRYEFLCPNSKLDDLTMYTNDASLIDNELLRTNLRLGALEVARKAVVLAYTKYPSIKDEILDDFDDGEYI